MFGTVRSVPATTGGALVSCGDARRGGTRGVPPPGPAGAPAAAAAAAAVAAGWARRAPHGAPDGAPPGPAAALGLVLHRGREDLLLAGAERALPEHARGVVLRLP